MKNTVTFLVLAGAFLFTAPANAKVKHGSQVAHHHKVVATVSKQRGESSLNKGIKNAKQLSEQQRQFLVKAYKAAKEAGIKKPEILSGIIMQESRAGETHGFRTSRGIRKSEFQQLGLSQVQVRTARAIVKENPELKERFNVSDKDFIKHLAHNDDFNIAVASYYMKYLYDIRRDDDFVIAAYNHGPGGVSKTPWKTGYVRAVRKHIKQYELEKLS